MLKKKLVIVESPTKARTISKFLDKNYFVHSSYGHLCDLPKSNLGVDVDNNFKPNYVVSKENKKKVAELKKYLEKSEEVILASDEDREGEAIAWHIAQILNLGEFGKNLKTNNKKDYKRIVFHEITKNAIQNALKNPRRININLVDAQQARRILDRLVGYKLSPFLWKKVRFGLSAGRVQSVAVRLIVERENEINSFKKEEYWTIKSLVRKTEESINNGNKDNCEFEANLISINKKPIIKLGIKTKDEAERIKFELKKENYIIKKINKKEIEKNPYSPFTTSTLQQTANNKFGYSAKQTMFVAQELYEGVEIGKGGSVGLITYMRTDSLNLSEESVDLAKNYIENKFGKNYFKKRIFKTKSKTAQEAHEAIRPTNPKIDPESVKKYLNDKQYKLYKIIWQRMIASQMASAIIDSTSVDIKAGEKYVLRSVGSILKFDGFMKVYPVNSEDTILPQLKENENLNLVKVLAEQHFTQPPPRYTEASLIKTMEKFGIGRPSTYAPTMSVIQERGYVEKIDRKFHPKDIGILVDKILTKHFPDIVNIKFTAKMENNLDEIAENKKDWVSTIKNFYFPFEKNLKDKEKEINKKDIMEEKTNEKCEKCGHSMTIKLGKFGKFMACSNFPECRSTKPFGDEKKLNKELSSEKCEKCGSQMQVKRGRFGSFLGCSGYPKCRNIKSIVKSTGVKCPECGEFEIVEKKSKRGKVFYGCNGYPKCKFALWNKPSEKKCKSCGSLMIYTKDDKIICSKKECEKARI